VVAYSTHLLSARREKQNREHADKTAREARRRNFLSFLEGVRAKAERRQPQNLSQVFRDRVYELRREAAKIRGDIDLGKQAKFAELIDVFCRLRDSEVEEILVSGDRTSYLGRDRVATAIDAIKSFVELA